MNKKIIAGFIVAGVSGLTLSGCSSSKPAPKITPEQIVSASYVVTSHGEPQDKVDNAVNTLKTATVYCIKKYANYTEAEREKDIPKDKLCIRTIATMSALKNDYNTVYNPSEGLRRLITEVDQALNVKKG